MSTTPSCSARLCVLVVEDDLGTAQAIRDGFSEHSIDVHHAPTLAAARELLSRSTPYDAMILDLSLPDGNGIDLAESCRLTGNEIPILMVSGKDSVNERIEGLSHGADDYVCKPFDVAELSARLDAVLRRRRPKYRHILTYGDIELDLLRRRVRREELDNALSAREVDLLAYLMMHPEEVLTKARILKDVWGDDAEDDSNVLHVYANYLRNKLEAGLYPRVLHTVRGVGYVLSVDEPET